MLLNCGAEEDSWESLRQQGDQTSPSILKEINSEYSLERLMLKLQYFGYLMQRANSLEKILMLGTIKGMTEDEMDKWHHWLNGHELEQVPGYGEGQGSLECCSPWGCKELDMTEQLNNNNTWSPTSCLDRAEVRWKWWPRAYLHKAIYFHFSQRWIACVTKMV